MEGLLEESATLFSLSNSTLEDGDPDKWECHYFLAKIYEKLGYPISEVVFANIFHFLFLNMNLILLG